MTKNNRTKDIVSPMTSLVEAMQDAGKNMMPKPSKTFCSPKASQRIQQIQAVFFKKTMNDYGTEMAKLMELGNSHEKHATPV